jgi:sugar O-acyltransferase (sialic acid O-acetyltransferase NeuD family)
MKDFVIIGAGDFGKEVALLIEDINKIYNQYNLLGYIDDYKETGIELNGYKVIGDTEYLIKLSREKELFGVISVQNPEVKKAFVKTLKNIKWETLIHPSAIITRTVTIGEGSIITAGNIISNNVNIGKHCLINLGCTVGHDNVIEDYVCIMPGCNLSGFTTLKEGSYLGTGVKVIPRITICEGAVIGAGAVVVRDIPEPGTYVGVPVRRID